MTFLFFLLAILSRLTDSVLLDSSFSWSHVIRTNVDGCSRVNREVKPCLFGVRNSIDSSLYHAFGSVLVDTPIQRTLSCGGIGLFGPHGNSDGREVQQSTRAEILTSRKDW